MGMGRTPFLGVRHSLSNEGALTRAEPRSLSFEGLKGPCLRLSSEASPKHVIPSHARLGAFPADLSGARALTGLEPHRVSVDCDQLSMTLYIELVLLCQGA